MTSNRLKCKCGKVLKISGDLAGKKVKCPACSAVYRVPQTTAAAGPQAPAKVATATVAKSAAASVAAATPPMVIQTAVTGPCPTSSSAADVASNPSDIELSAAAIAATPSELDLLSEIDLIPPGPVCPNCKKMQPANAKICVTCGINLATGESLLPAGKGTPQNLGYARGRDPKASSQSDELQRSYWSNIARSFGYPLWSSNNALSFLVVTIVAILQEWFKTMGVIGLASIILAGWLAGLYLRVVQDTAMGIQDLPSIKMEDGPWDDIIKPAFRFIGAYAFALVPAATFVILLTSGVLPAFMRSGEALLLWFAGGIFAWPIFVMLFAFDEWKQSYRVDLIITTIARTLLPYLGLWLMLLIVGATSILPLLLPLLDSFGIDLEVNLFDRWGIAGHFAFAVLDVYLTIVTMRQIGLFYLHFKNRFTFSFE